MKRFKTILTGFALIVALCYGFYEKGQHDARKQAKQRVWAIYGEGDLGTEINYELFKETTK